MTKKKRVIAITDGKEVERVVVFESVSLQFVDKKGYMLTGYALRGENPPFSINFTRETKLFSSVGVPITPDLEERGRQLLYPPSLKCSLLAAREETAMVSVQGKIKEVSSVGKVQVGRDFVPRKTLMLEQEAIRVQVTLWREAALFSVAIGAQVSFTHLRGSQSPYGYGLNSTVHTTMEEACSEEEVNALGTMEAEGRPGMLHLLTAPHF
ncbi:uncharacterized protein LOC117821998 isoform X2 [Notolabrus celidotus]|uniref:uncharacterized protein LOC117821998 isoform X2 n=1 Tax=Notolabrus celidotus TaxID=1203425 RepID=UPI00148F5115|nr:uncharacterized protein LOC117821998 isoform X2 [Notolabrus celidotus]XP_034552497.1 uncharacterized protein LOC117821998 isoform X2 [Notolabrus celidotus]